MEIRRWWAEKTRVFTYSKLGVWRCTGSAPGLELSGHVSRRALTKPCMWSRAAHSRDGKSVLALIDRWFLSRCKAALPPFAAAVVVSSFSVPLTTFSFFSWSPSFLEPQPCSHSLSSSLLRSPLLRSAELNLNDTLVGGKESLSDLIVLVSPFRKSCRNGRGVSWSVRDRDGRESSLVEYLKTTHPSYVFPKGALAYLRSIISAYISVYIKIYRKRRNLVE